MVKKSLDQYKGRLLPEQIAEGMNAAVRNATSLVDDANLLLERKRFPSAVALAILAIEEAGKTPSCAECRSSRTTPKRSKIAGATIVLTPKRTCPDCFRNST